MPILTDQRGVAPILFVVIGLLILGGVGVTGFALIKKPSNNESPVVHASAKPSSSPSFSPSPSIRAIIQNPSINPSSIPVISPGPSTVAVSASPSMIPQTTSSQAPTPTPLPSPSPSTVAASPISVSTSFVSVTLKRSEAQSGLIYGSGFSITSQGADGFQIKYTGPTQGVGFYESSGGLTNGAIANIRSYINGNKANGTYDGMAIIQYQKNNSWFDGPVVAYSITLID